MEPVFPAQTPQLPPQLVEALHRPFSHLDVQLRPEAAHEQPAEKPASGTTWRCLAVPWVPRWIYEARLDQVAPGAWSSTSPSIVVAGDRLTITALVRIGSLAHTGYGETRLAPPEMPDDLTGVVIGAPEAYAQAFIDACHRFGLGRFLLHLERRQVPYDPQHQRVNLSAEKQATLVQELYRQAGLPLDLPPTRTIVRTPTRPVAAAPQPAAPPLSARKPDRKAPGAVPSTSGTAASPDPQADRRAHHLGWLREHCTGKPLENILRHYQLTCLEDLSDAHLAALYQRVSQRLRQAS